MGIRSLVLVSFAAVVVSLAPSSHAGTGGSGGAGTSGGGTGGFNPECTVAQESVAGTMCVACDPSSTCGALDATYQVVCMSSADEAVFCNGPSPTQPMDQNVAACAVAVPGGAAGGLVLGGALAVAVAGLGRRRRRP